MIFLIDFFLLKSVRYPVIIHVNKTACTFAGNKTTNENGGAICNEVSSISVITNCTFADNHANSASGYGGAIYNKGNGKAVIYNSIFWGNTSKNSNAKDIYNDQKGTPGSADVRYSLLEDGYTGGIGIISGDPKLISVDININAETPATSADVYMYIISGDSAARGEGLAVGETISGNVKVPDTDQVGNPRTISMDGAGNKYYVDLGAYQFSSKEEGHTPSYSFPVLSITSAEIKVGESVDVTVTAKPSNFINLGCTSTIAAMGFSKSNGRWTGVILTGNCSGSETTKIDVKYKGGETFTKDFILTVIENVTVASGDTKTYKYPYSVDDLTLESGAALEIGASGALTVKGDFRGGSDSKIRIAGGGSLSFEGSVSGTPDLYITGDFSKVKLFSENPLTFGTIYVNGSSGYNIVWKDGVGTIVSGSLSVTLPEKLTISLARDAYVTASVSPDTAGTFTWSSSSTDIVAVSADNASKPNAKLTSGVSEGKAEVTVTFVTSDGREALAKCEVTVTNTTAAVSPKSIDITALPADTVVVSTDISAKPAAGASDDIAYYNAPEQAKKTIDSLTIALDGTRIPIAEAVAAKVTAVSDLMPLPVAKVTSYDSESGKKSVILTIKASGASMPKNAVTVGDLSYLKLRRDTLTYDTIDRVESDNALAATDTKSVWLIRTDGGTICKAADKLDRNMVYELNIAVKDDGIYDHNTAVKGKVVDPGFLAYLKPSQGSGSGGGCNAGAAGLAMLLLSLPLAWRRRK